MSSVALLTKRMGEGETKELSAWESKCLLLGVTGGGICVAGVCCCSVSCLS